MVSEISPFDQNFDRLLGLIREEKVADWVEEKAGERTLETLRYLVKFAYMTGLINKAEIRRCLGLDASEAKLLVRQWYKEHREKGCGAC